MKRTGMLTLAGALLYALAAGAHAAVEVFACEPEWAALVRELGGGHVPAIARLPDPSAR